MREHSSLRHTKVNFFDIPCSRINYPTNGNTSPNPKKIGMPRLRKSYYAMYAISLSSLVLLTLVL